MAGIEGHLEILLDFMRVLCPSYFLAVAIASGSSSSLIFYNIVLFLIYIVEVQAGAHTGRRKTFAGDKGKAEAQK